MLRLQTAQLPATALTIKSRLRFELCASAEVQFFPRNSKAVLQEWSNAAVRQASPFCGVTQQVYTRRH